ncbi:NUDIX hydrolase [Candidatus Kaiserbacteria bacterium]|nr:NUDIX hydrolase [Candidatus Kaiserbacteria bacterium]
MVTIVYAGKEFPESWSKSIMLVGPTPRSPKPGQAPIPSWRPAALAYLEEIGYDGVVFVPEPPPGEKWQSFDAQVLNEKEMLHDADVIVAWIPRKMDGMPALTTNDEFGRWKNSGKMILGAPEDAVSVRYQQKYAQLLSVPSFTTMEETLKAAVDRIGTGALRTLGERHVPLHVWKTAFFQKWYANLRAAGNRLDGARVEWTFRVGPKKDFVLYWAMHVDIYVAAEGRNKSNEVVVSRPDISVICGFRRMPDILDSEIVLIKEFRSPCSNSEGFVFELPGGSSFKPNKDSLVVAGEEFEQETGLMLDPIRFQIEQSRQLAATLSAHAAYLVSVQMTEGEMDDLRSKAGVAYGVVGETERTYVVVKTLREILEGTVVDWSMTGMILSVLNKKY